jgi:hypothetical protein
MDGIEVPKKYVDKIFPGRIFVLKSVIIVMCNEATTHDQKIIKPF